jgi:murein DD-endopeptidase MepM/ murein hydrolase activator NlpD
MSKLLLGFGALVTSSFLVEVALPSLMPPRETAATAAGAEASIAGGGPPGSPFGGACRPVVTQPYGPTDVVGEPIINGQRFHTGIDLACPQGTPVHSLTDGVAHVTSGWSSAPCCAGIGGGFGNNVVVAVDMRLGSDVEPQHYFVRYAHLLGDIAVADGQVVRPGDLLGFEGSTGFSTGPHLHFEVDRGAPSVQDSIDPSALLVGA